MSLIQNNDSRIAGCVLSSLDAKACEGYLDWLIDKADPPEGVNDLVWMLGHFDDGVTWARRDPEKRSWISGHAVAATISPAIRRETLQELRLFGGDHEILIWRTASGLRGREVRDVGDGQEPAFLRPADEARVLRGDRIQDELADGFTCVTDTTGARQVLPISVTKKQLDFHKVQLLVRHYFEQDDRTGAVRVALTRLVSLSGGDHGA